MIARLLTALLTSALLLVALGVVAALQAGRPGVALTVLALPVLVLLASFALEAVLLLRFRGDDPTPRPGAASLARALLGELAAAFPRFGWHQARAWAAEDADLDTRRHAGHTGLLLVHGYFCNHGFWWAWKRRLRAQDRPFIAVTLEPAFGDIDRTAPILQSAVERLVAATGGPVVVVAHSMGGLALRSWWAAHPRTADAHVARAITIGTPHRGTELARLAHTRNGSQMKPDSPWLQALAAREPGERRRRFTAFYGHCDNIVFPPARARWEGADNRHLTGVAHVDMADHPDVLAEVEAQLRQADATGKAGPRGLPGEARQGSEGVQIRSDATCSPASISGRTDTSR